MAFIEDIVTQLRRLETALNESAAAAAAGARQRSAARPARLSAPHSQPAAPVAQLPRCNAARSGRRRVRAAHDAAARSRVLIAELARHRLDWQANVRRSDLQARCRQLLTHPQLIDFPSLLHAWPRRFRRTARRTAKYRLNRRLQRQQRQLRRALADTGYDRHRLRLLIKRLRYAAEAYPQRLPSLPKRRRASKRRKTPSATGTIGRSGACRPSIRRISGRCCPMAS